jgi:hypothetical protein
MREIQIWVCKYFEWSVKDKILGQCASVKMSKRLGLVDERLFDDAIMGHFENKYTERHSN